MDRTATVATLIWLWPAIAWSQGAAVPGGGDKLEWRSAPKPTLIAEDALAVKPGGLTAQVVAERAVANSEALRARQAEVDATAAKLEQTLVAFLPRFSVKASYARLSRVQQQLNSPLFAATGEPMPATSAAQVCNPAGPYGGFCISNGGGQVLPVAPIRLTLPTVQDRYALGATLAIPISDLLLRRSRAIAAARSSESAARLNQQAEQRRTAADARVAYYNWVRGVAGSAVAESALVRITALRRDTEAAYSVGSSTKADVLRVEALAASTELTIAQAHTVRELAASQLAMLMGDTAPQYEIGEAVGAGVSTAELPAVQDFVSDAKQLRLELRAIGEAERSLGASAAETRIGELPRLDAFGEYGYARPNEWYLLDPSTWHGHWMVGVNLSWTANDVFSSRAGAAEVDANRRKLSAERENLRRSLEMEVTAAYLDAKSARVAVTTSERGLKSAQEAYRVTLDLYRVGRATTSEVIAAEQELLTAALRQVNAAIDHQQARTRLLHASGRDPGEQARLP